MQLGVTRAESGSLSRSAIQLLLAAISRVLDYADLRRLFESKMSVKFVTESEGENGGFPH